jgi:hypothetical protein
MAAAVALIIIAGIALAGLAAALGLTWRAERHAEYRGEHRIRRESHQGRYTRVSARRRPA